jgi:hypothetical protein
MIFPPSGIPISTGTAWGTSLTAIAPSTWAFLDPTSSVQGQFNLRPLLPANLVGVLTNDGSGNLSWGPGGSGGGTVLGATVNGGSAIPLALGILNFQFAVPQTVGFGFKFIPSGSGNSTILTAHANLAPVVFTTSGTVLAAQAAGLVICNSASPITLSLPQAAFPSGNPNFIQGDPVSFLNNGAGTCAISPTTSTITNGTSSGLASYTLPAAAAGVPSSVQMVSDLTGNYTVTNFSPQVGAALTFTGDTTGSGSTPIALTTVRLNGVLLSGLSTGLVKNTNGTGAPSIATAHDVSASSGCVAASGSGTAYTCTTSPTFVPAAGDEIIFKSDVASGTTPTLNVNASSAAGVFKWGGGTALAANDFLAAARTVLIYDGTHWQAQGIH